MSADNYPVGMSICDSTGLAGNCGRICEAYQAGDCENHEEFINNGDLSDEDLQEYYDIYGNPDEEDEEPVKGLVMCLDNTGFKDVLKIESVYEYEPGSCSDFVKINDVEYFALRFKYV